MDTLVEVRALSKAFRREGAGIRRTPTVQAVDRVSFKIARGSIFGLVGESGCGKTTLARSLLFLTPPDSGEVIYDGISLGTLPRRELRSMRSRMQIVFQHPHTVLNPRMPLKSLLEEPLRNRGLGSSERHRKLLEAIEQVGLDVSSLGKYPHEFSGGQRQRITLARALAMGPEFLVLDEPVSNLDVSIQAQIVNLLLDLKAAYSLTYLFISHDLNLVSYLSDTVAVMDRGRMVEMAETEELLSNPLHASTLKLLYSIPGKSGEARTASYGERSGAGHFVEGG